jgi:hypothetical protein
VQNLFCGWSAKFILRLECKIYFAVGVQNLFCGWSAKFIFAVGVQNLFLRLECKIYFAFILFSDNVLKSHYDSN